MDDDTITYPINRKPGPRSFKDSGIPFRRVHAIVCNGRMAEVFDAVCFLEGRRPHQLVHDVMLAYLTEKADDPIVRKAITAPGRANLRIVQ